jgi:hypothetical protein
MASINTQKLENVINLLDAFYNRTGDLLSNNLSYKEKTSNLKLVNTIRLSYEKMLLDITVEGLQADEISYKESANSKLKAIRELCKERMKQPSCCKRTTSKIQSLAATSQKFCKDTIQLGQKTVAAVKNFSIATVQATKKLAKASFQLIRKYPEYGAIGFATLVTGSSPVLGLVAGAALHASKPPEEQVEPGLMNWVKSHKIMILSGLGSVATTAYSYLTGGLASSIATLFLTGMGYKSAESYFPNFRFIQASPPPPYQPPVEDYKFAAPSAPPENLYEEIKYPAL